MTGVDVPPGRRVRWHLLVGAAAVVLVLVLGCGAVWYLSRSATRAHHERAGHVLVAYLDRVQHDDYRGAYRMLCNDTLYGYTESDHVRFLREQPDFVAFRITDEPFVRSDPLDGTDLVYQVDFRYADGSAATSEFVVELVSDGATVCDSPYDRSPAPGR